MYFKELKEFTCLKCMAHGPTTMKFISLCEPVGITLFLKELFKKCFIFKKHIFASVLDF